MLSSVMLCAAAAVASVTPDAAELQLFEGADQQTYFRVLIGGQQVLRSEGYTSKAGAVNGLESVVTNGVAEGNYRVSEAKDGRWFFVLRAQNYQTIAVSSRYYQSEGDARHVVAEVEGALRGLLLAQRAVYTGVEGASFVVLKSRNGGRHFHLRAADGKKLLFGDGYRTEAEAAQAVLRVFVAGHSKRQYVKRENRGGQHFFQLRVLETGTHLAVSNMFASEAQRNAAINTAHATLRTLVGKVVAAALETEVVVPQ